MSQEGRIQLIEVDGVKEEGDGGRRRTKRDADKQGRVGGGRGKNTYINRDSAGMQSRSAG